MLLRIFQQQVELQCRAALSAAAEVDAALARSSAGPDLWIPVQNLLTAAANLSKAFWGQSGSDREVQRKPLRDSLHV